MRNIRIYMITSKITFFDKFIYNQWQLVYKTLTHCDMYRSGGSTGRRGASPLPQRDPILSFLHRFPPKSARISSELSDGSIN